MQDQPPWYYLETNLNQSEGTATATTTKINYAVVQNDRGPLHFASLLVSIWIKRSRIIGLEEEMLLKDFLRPLFCYR